MRDLLIATGNEGKVREIKLFLEGQPFTILGLSDVGIEREADEVGTTFESNALIKAFTYGKWSNMLTLAEDSGLEIDALHGRPGVYTKPYTEGTSDHGQAKILDELKDIPDEKRGAQVHSLIVLYDPSNDKVRICEGITRGRIPRAPRGVSGFGQDPIFEVDSGKTFAEMTSNEKNSVSHRGKALTKAKEVLLSEFV